MYYLLRINSFEFKTVLCKIKKQCFVFVLLINVFDDQCHMTHTHTFLILVRCVNINNKNVDKYLSY